MAESSSFARDGHFIVCTPMRFEDGKYQPRFRIYRGATSACELIYEQTCPSEEFGSAADANRYAAEVASFWLDQWPIKGCFIRATDGRAFSYLGTYSVGHGADWNARVYCDGDLKGTPSGVFVYNFFRHANITHAAENMIVESINHGIGITD
jgi:hypothetical protein